MPQPLRVLLVEDSEDDALLLMSALRSAGYDLVSERIESAAEMRQALACGGWDIILCDHNLPGFDAPSALRLLRAVDADLPFIIISGTIGEDVAIEALKQGADDFLLKQNLRRLIPAIERSLHDAENRRRRRAAERLLAEREAQYRAVIETSAEGFVMADMQGRILEVNDAYARVSGYSREALLGMTIADLEAAENPEAVADHIRRIAEQGSDLFESRGRTRDGTVWEMEVSAAYWPIAGGRVFGFLRDIRRRKRSECLLHARLALSDLALRGSLDDLLKATLDMVQLRTGSRTGFFHLADKEYAGGVGEARGQQQLTVPILCEERVAAVIGVGGKATGYTPEDIEMVQDLASLAMDLVERKRAEEALRASEERFRSLVETTFEWVWELDAEGHYTYASPKIYDLLGYQPEEVIGLSPFELMPPEEARRVAGAFAEIVDAHRPFSAFESINRHKSGRLVTLESSGVPVFDSAGNLTGYRGMDRDITDRVQLEERLRQAQKMESVGRLAGGVAHDFNNLLTVINGYSDLMLARLNPADPYRASIEEIRRAGARAASLTGQLLAFSRKQVLQPRPLVLAHVLQDMQSMLARLLGEDIELSIELDAADGVINADPHQVEQVIMNLVVNARDAMPHGGRLSLRTACASDETGRYVTLVVADNGTGMDAETRRRIFEPFFTTKESGRGTGLGLSVVLGVVEQSGGRIEVESAPGHGTTFRVILPRTDVKPSELSKPEASIALSGKETILIVEDQPEVREFAAAALAGYGYKVIKSETAGDALLIFEREKERIDLVLTDVVMPHIGGWELATRLTALRPEVRVLYMSGYADVDEKFQVSGVELIQKPFGPRQLAARVREMLGPARASGRLLVVDDETGVRRFLRTALERAGYQVEEAADGRQALKLARLSRPDLVLTDLVMPEQEGIETIRALRREMPGVRIIAMSGRFDDSFLQMLLVLGADAALRKPIGIETLLSKVSDVLMR